MDSRWWASGIREGGNVVYAPASAHHNGSPSLKDSRPHEGEFSLHPPFCARRSPLHRSNAASSAPSSTRPASVLVTRSCASVCAVLRSPHTTLVGSSHSRTFRKFTPVSRPTTTSRRTDWSTCKSRRAEERVHQRRRGQQQVRPRERSSYTIRRMWY